MSKGDFLSGRNAGLEVTSWLGLCCFFATHLCVPARYPFDVSFVCTFLRVCWCCAQLAVVADSPACLTRNSLDKLGARI
jgi:hypothetical protein